MHHRALMRLHEAAVGEPRHHRWCDWRAFAGVPMLQRVSSPRRCRWPAYRPRGLPIRVEGEAGADATVTLS
jgi:hypothetical protein